MNAPRRRDPFPFVLGGIIAVLLVGVIVVVFLISSNNTTVSGAQPTTVAQVPTTGPVDTGATTPEGTAGPTEEPAPRMTLEDFKKLYDDPAKRPLIIDVRAKEVFDAGHIKGSISFPEGDVDTRLKDLPKDKLIVAYCQ